MSRAHRDEVPSGSEPEWPMDNPGSLLRWLENNGRKGLGREVNRWIGLISYASSMIREAASGADRRGFRDVALAAADAGRRLSVLSESVYLERAVYARMFYLRTSNETPDWQRREMEGVLNLFLDSVPMDLSAARDTSRDWQAQPIQVVKSLRETKIVLNLMKPGEALLPAGPRETLEEWLSLLPQLP